MIPIHKSRCSITACSVTVCLLVLSLLIGNTAWSQTETKKTKTDKTNPTVGAPGSIYQIILPGSELVGKPLVDGSPMVVRVVNVFPHGDRFRYDLRFHGMEPGQYNLADWLIREDGTATDDLPTIPVEIMSLLPEGQIEPNELETGWLPRIGGYQVVFKFLVGVWITGLLALIFVGRKKSIEAQKQEKQATLADLLRSRIEAAFANTMDASGYAELERMLVAFWQKRLKLDGLPAHEALAAIKADAEAGPLVRQIETWMHSPNPDKNVDLTELLKPFRNLPADTSEFVS